MASREHLAIVDVGHGSAAVLVDSSGTVVIDAGPKAGLLEYLRETGIRRVDVVLISHADQDHLGGLLGLLASGEVSVGVVRLNTDSEKASRVWDDLVYELDCMRRRGVVDFETSLIQGDDGRYDQGVVHIEIVGPSAYLATKGPGSVDRLGARISTNSISAVIRLHVKGVPLVLFCGDLDEVGLRDLVRVGASLRAAVLVYPHHGGRSGSNTSTAFAEQLIRLVEPSTVVFSIGRGVHATPQPEVVDAVCRLAGTAHIVCTQLSERCSSAVPASEPGHLAPVYAQGKERRACCGGTLIFSLASSASMLPARPAHQAFVTAAAPSALCRLVRS